MRLPCQHERQSSQRGAENDPSASLKPSRSHPTHVAHPVTVQMFLHVYANVLYGIWKEKCMCGYFVPYMERKVYVTIHRYLLVEFDAGSVENGTGTRITDPSLITQVQQTTSARKAESSLDCRKNIDTIDVTKPRWERVESSTQTAFICVFTCLTWVRAPVSPY